MPQPRLLFVLLMVCCALLSRNLAWGQATLLHNLMPSHAPVALVSEHHCQDETESNITQATDEKSCQIACDLGNMPPMSTMARLEPDVLASIQVPHLPVLALAHASAPDKPPPR